jgi:hypothetical protein
MGSILPGVAMAGARTSAAWRRVLEIRETVDDMVKSLDLTDGADLR